MNSKQDLDNLYDNLDCQFCEHRLDCGINNAKISKCQEWRNTIKRDLDRLEQLEQKETPKKLILGVNQQYRRTMNCPRCGNVFVTFYNEVESLRHLEYCYKCGQHIDWSEDDK